MFSVVHVSSQGFAAVLTGSSVARVHKDARDVKILDMPCEAGFMLKPSQAKPSQAKPSQAKPSQAKPSQAKPSQAKPSQAKPSQ
ncbi:MAG: hypothetical protein LBO00_02850, partial [Zoogloeaceae bacterium]|nr:hypothetical protein [Zoogloeaceae bacterium]